MVFSSVKVSRGQDALFYLVAPKGLRSSTFSLRDVERQLRSALADQPELRTVVHVVPSSSVFDSPTSSTSSSERFEAIASAVYDRVRRSVPRLVPRSLFVDSDSVSSIRYPALHLSRSPSHRVELSAKWPATSLNLSDRRTMLHVAYSASPEWIAAFAVDELGFSQAHQVWRVSGCTEGERLVEKVWAFVRDFTSKADVEWDLVVCRAGAMPFADLLGKSPPPLRFSLK